MVDKISGEFASRPIVGENLTMEQEFREWVQTITDRSLLVGIGSPEGVVHGLVAWSYMDETGTPGAIMYIKRDADIAGDTTKGWVLI